MSRIPCRKTRPTLEVLEERQLLDSKLPHLPAQDAARLALQAANDVPVSDRRILYTTPEGTHVALTLYGLGSLKGTTVDSNGVLHLVYDNTDSNTRIMAHVSGGTRSAKIASITDADAKSNETSGVGDNQLGGLKLPKFDLIDGGRVDLLGGINDFQLNSVGSNTLLNFRSLPLTSQQTNPSTTSPTEVLMFNVQPGGATELTGLGGFTVPGSAGTTNATSAGSSTSSGFTFSNIGGGQIVPATSNTIQPAVRPPGVDIKINHINGSVNAGDPLLGPPQVFAYDPTSNALIRFNATTGEPLQAMTLNIPSSAKAGVGLGFIGEQQVVLVAAGTDVQVLSALNGASLGTFSIDTLASEGITTVDGIAETDGRTLFVDASAGSTGTIQAINVQQSLATGHAVAVGKPFSPTNQFLLSGGATGVAGSGTAYFTGSAHFDTFEPNAFKFGILSVNASSTTLSETDRTAITSPSSIVNVDPANPPTTALGSIDQNLALITGLDGEGHNSVALYSARNLSRNGSLTLDYPNLLTGLSESFHPELTNRAVINVRGITNYILSQDVQGLVFNDIGYLNQISINSAVDSVFVALPIGHVGIYQRQNVTLISSARPPGKRGHVTIKPDLGITGPLTPPT